VRPGAARVGGVERSRVAVAIVNANSGRYLPRAIAALSRQTRPADRILVVDNGSTDGSSDGLENDFAGIEVIRLGRNAGFAAANNVAARRADDCEWLALLNPDAFPEPSWLAELLEATAQKPSHSFFASQLVMASDPQTLDAAGDAFHVSGVAWQRQRGAPTSAAAAPGEVFSPSAAAALYRRDAFLQVGGFDERFFCYFEDVDLGFRLRLAGHRCWYVPSAVVHHVGSATSGRESDFVIYHTHRNIVWTFAKNMPSPLLWVYLPQHVLVGVLTLVAYAALRRFGLVLTAKRDALRELPAVLRNRRALQRGRVVSASELRDAMATGLDVLPVLLRRSRELAAAAPTEPAAPPPSRRA
jgi:GT2 family glycosyltransferase